MNKKEKEKLLVEEIKKAIEAVVFENIQIMEEKSFKCKLENYFCKKIKNVSLKNKIVTIEFFELPPLKFVGVDVIYGNELLESNIIKQINFIKVIKRRKGLYVSAMVEVKKRRSLDFLEFYTEKIC